MNLIVIAAIGYLGMTAFVNPDQPGQSISGSENIYPVNGDSTSSAPDAQKMKIDAKLSSTITKRNLFKVEVELKEAALPLEPETKAPAVEELEPTDLKLVLWGTVAVGSTFYAVIEDQTVREQSLYEKGDTIQKATIKEILPKKVILSVQDKQQVLEMNEEPGKRKRSSRTAGLKSSYSSRNGSKPVKPTSKSAKRRQVKFRPHTTQGEPDGMMIYGIRPDSIYRKHGLRNGDVIKSINQTPVESIEDAQSIFNDPQQLEDARITLVRRGQVKELEIQASQTQAEHTDNLEGEN